MSRLPDRSVISVRGPNSTKFLQNLITQDINLFAEEAPNRAAVFTTFLTPKGKILYDAIIVKPLLAAQYDQDSADGQKAMTNFENAPYIEYWIDVHEKDAQPLTKHLKRYALRNKEMEIQDISHIIKSF